MCLHVYKLTLLRKVINTKCSQNLEKYTLQANFSPLNHIKNNRSFKSRLHCTLMHVKLWLLIAEISLNSLQVTLLVRLHMCIK